MSTMRDVDTSLPATAQLDSRVDELMQMGFPEDLATRALARCAHDFNKALDMLTKGEVPPEDDFDLLAAASVAGGSTTKPPKADPSSGDKTAKEDTFRVGGVADDSAALVDSRVSTLVEMGFRDVEAERALSYCKGDFDAAVTMLTSASEGDLSA